MKKFILSALLFLAFVCVKSQDLMNLEPTGYVNDYENVFTVEQKDSLENFLSNYDKKTSIEICVATSADFDFEINSTELAEKWGVGKEGLDNGLFIGFSPSQRKYAIETGYGLESFLPDAKVNQFVYDMKNSFRENDYYGGVKELINNMITHLGNDGYDMLVKNKELREAKIKAKTKAFFVGALKVLFILIVVLCIGFLIYVRIQKRKKFLKLREEIFNIIVDIMKLKVSLNDGKELPNEGLNIHQMRIAELSEGTYDKVTKKMVTEDSKKAMKSIYNDLLDYKITINSIKKSVDNIKKYETDVQTYLKDNYPYCVDYLKNELNDISNFIGSKQIDKMLDDGDFNMKKRYELMNIESALENKLNKFLNKTAKINTIVVDYKNINKKLNYLNIKNSEYIRKKNILAGAKIGKRYDSLVNLNFNNVISELKLNIDGSFNSLNSGKLNEAFDKYSGYVTNLAMIDGAFRSVDSLYSTYQRSVDYIKNNKSKMLDWVTKVESKSHKSGVSHSQRSDFLNSKSDIDKFGKLEKVDIILAATLLATILSNLKKVYENMKDAISDYNKPSYSSTSYSSPSYTSNGGGGSFGGFGGGSFGGGGSRGGW